jgi:hypothetical protein
VDDGGSSFSAAPGSYTFVVEMAMKEGVVCTYQLLPGWNLINIPLAQVTDGVQLMEMDVRNWRRQPVDSAEKLLAGNGYWVRNAGDQPRTVTITGKAYIRREASMEKADATWKCLGVTAQYNAASDELDAGAISVRGWTWDAEKQAFVPVAEKAKATRAYILK